MTWADITSRGSGTIVGYRLMIEGWPDEFVTNPSITHSTNADGRSVYPGLLYDGLRTRERMDIRSGLLEADGITFRVVSTNDSDEAMASFTTEASPVASLEAAINSTTVALSSSVALSASTVYHIATEAVQTGTISTTAPAITRTVWDTQLQVHNITSVRKSQNVPIYDRPATMEGRRATLYVYGDGDTLTGDGTAVYRGVVSGPPELASDGVTWEIRTDSITSLLRHKVGSGEVATGIAGNVQYNQASAFWVRVTYGGSNESKMHKILGPLETQDLETSVNTALANALSSASATNILSATFQAGKDGAPHTVTFETNTTAPSSVHILLGSPIDGIVYSRTAWVDENGLPLATPVVAGGPVADTIYYGNASYEIPGLGRDMIEPPLTSQRAALGRPELELWDAHFSGAQAVRSGYEPYKTDSADTRANHVLPSGTSLSDFPSWRLFIRNKLGSVEAVHITDTLSPSGIFEVDAVGSIATINAAYLDIHPQQLVLGDSSTGGISGKKGVLTSFFGHLSEETVITPVLKYGFGVDVAGFMNTMVSKSIDANDGETPFITLWDVATTGGAANWGVTRHIVPKLTEKRNYQFKASKSLEEILEHELPLVQHMLYLDSNEKLDIKPIPFFTNDHPVDATHTINADSVLTPEGSRGAWVGWRPQADGLVNVINYQWEYDPGEDSHLSDPIELKHGTSIATHKTRGKGSMDLTPFSNPSQRLPLEDMKDAAESIAKMIFGWAARDYAVVTVKVPFIHYDVRLGDIVALTDSRTPNGDGTRGVTGKRGMVIGREWNHDPSDDDMGELTLLLPQEQDSGYTPSGVITGQAGATTAWTLTLSSANADNIEWSTTGNGKVVQHFIQGDFIRIEKVTEEDGSSTITGTVASDGNTTADTVAVTLDSTWSPSTVSWVLEYDNDATGTNMTSHQKEFVYVAGSDKALPWSGYARKFK